MDHADELGDFRPSLRNISGNTWEASISLPVVGNVTTDGNGWEEAKMRLWLVSKAVNLLASQKCKDPRDWSDDEWRSTLKIMRDVMSPEKESTAEGTLEAFKVIVENFTPPGYTTSDSTVTPNKP